MGAGAVERVHGGGAKAWAAYAATVVSPSDVMQMWEVLTSLAREGDLKAIQLWMGYAVGPPGKTRIAPETVSIADAAELDTVEGCRTATMRVLEAQLSGAIDTEQAAALRATIDLALRSLAAESGIRSMEALMGAGAEAIYLDASKDPVEQFASMMGERGEQDDDGD